MTPPPSGPRPGGGRDLRIDLFRGLAMFIILIDHIPANPWGRWTVGKFAFSDATEIFVFCSGMAAALSFGRSFDRAGWAIGTARTAYRIWQLYWAHIGLFFFVAAMMAAFDLIGAVEGSYVGRLNLWPFFDNPVPQIVGLFTLTYVPNYFDILPMYLGTLALMPVILALARVHPRLAMGASAGVWLACNLGLLALPAEPWSDREWFFNPFGWQLLFFTGFAFVAGWLPAPPVRRGLVWAALGFLLLSSPLASPHAVTLLKQVWMPAADWAMETYPKILGLRTKTEFGILRYLHFLALAYLAWAAMGSRGTRLAPTGRGLAVRAWRGLVAVTVQVGQQSLAIFVFSMALAPALGFALDVAGRTAIHIALANLLGLAALAGAAYGIDWIKAQPWKPRPA
ncbi:MAG: OpgC family protein [Rhodovulum sp.]